MGWRLHPGERLGRPPWWREHLGRVTKHSSGAVITQWLKIRQKTVSLAGPKLRAHPEETEDQEQMEEIWNEWRKHIPQKASGHGRLGGNQKCGVKVG